MAESDVPLTKTDAPASPAVPAASEFSLIVPSSKEIEKELVVQEAPPSEEKAALLKQVEQNTNAIMNIDLESSDARRQIIEPIANFGLETMNVSASKNNMLKVTVGQLAQAGEEGGVVSKSLVNLQNEITDLDPSGVDFMRKGIFAKIFNPVRRYFSKYQKSENVISNILESLEQGKNTLKNDNTTLELESSGLRVNSKKLKSEIELGSALDESISKRLAEAKAQNADPDKIRFVEEEVLFPLRQRIMDMNQMLVVTHQGIIAMEVVQRNNRELVRGVDRAMTVTVSALRTSITVASALYNQKITLQKIKALNETTGNLISETSKMLKEQGTAIHKDAVESTISIDLLKKSFDDVLASLNEISRFKQEALPKMRETISAFKELADKGETEISKMEKGSAYLNAGNSTPARQS
ncbi:MAG: toxic anion resistance protein [Deltaproteobacteria bacterium]|jgi:uncharacterized protein YaaN involved in tellurite resistance|nr:toxic anion resistance protein [Deltaproteobacteria bacterium]